MNCQKGDHYDGMVEKVENKKNTKMSENMENNESEKYTKVK